MDQRKNVVSPKVQPEMYVDARELVWKVQAKPTHFKTSDKEAVQGAQTCVGGHEVICRMSARQDSSPI